MKQLAIITVIIAVALLAWLLGAHLASDARAMAFGVIIVSLLSVLWICIADTRGADTHIADRTPQPRVRVTHVHHVQLPPPAPPAPAPLATNAIIVGGAGLPALTARQQPPAYRQIAARPTSGHGHPDTRIWRTTHDVPAGWLDEW